MSAKSESSQLLSMLNKYGVVTAKQARDRGIRCPGARARELAENGYTVIPCWQLVQPQTLKRPAGTRRGKSQNNAVNPLKNNKSEPLAASASEINSEADALAGAE
jgi:hypothetical protein